MFVKMFSKFVNPARRIKKTIAKACVKLATGNSLFLKDGVGFRTVVWFAKHQNVLTLVKGFAIGVLQLNPIVEFSAPVDVDWKQILLEESRRSFCRGIG